MPTIKRRDFLKSSALTGAALSLTGPLLIPGNKTTGDAKVHSGQPPLAPGGTIPVGNKKQLFVDHKFMQTSHGIEHVMNKPWQTGEELITTDQPYEKDFVISPYSSVLKEDDGRIRIWYFIRPRDGTARNYYISYAESFDGIHFQKPELGLHEINGSSANNIVITPTKFEYHEIMEIGGCSVWKDPLARPEHRYKTQAKTYDRPFRFACLMHSSPDGIHWKPFKHFDAAGPKDTQTIIFWDKHFKQYLFYSRHRSPGPPIGVTWGPDQWKKARENQVVARKVRRAVMTDPNRDHIQVTNTDLVAWPDTIDQNTYPVPDHAIDPRTGFKEAPFDYYGATVFPYEEADSIYIMLAQTFWHWMDESSGRLTSKPGAREVRLGISRDSKHFDWAGNRLPFLRMGHGGRFDACGVWALPNPVIMGDEIWIYYHGTNRSRADEGRIDPFSPDGTVRNAISRAVMRLDGFVSADASPDGGEIITPPLTFTGKQLELNVDTSAGGTVRVEILDEYGKPLEGFSGDASRWIVGNSVRMPVTWSQNPVLSQLQNRPVRLKFTMRSAKLYAFQFKD